MDTGRKLPRNANYMSHLPLAMSSMSKRRTYFPVNGQSFSATGNNIIRIDISGDAFLDTKNSYLTFRFNNTTGFAAGFDFGSGHGFIRRLRIEQAGNVLTDCNNYNKLLSSILLPCQGDRDSVKSRSITENCRYNNDKANGNATAPTPLTDVTGASMTTPAQGVGLVINNAIAPPGVPTAGSTATFCIPLVNGLLGVNQQKMIPLQLLGSSPLTIEIEIAPSSDIGVFAGVPAAYTLDTVRYVAQLVETPPALDEQLRMVQEQSGGAIMLSGVDYTSFQGNISAGATGQQNINVPARRRSIKSILWVGASRTFVAGGAAAQDVLFNQSFGGNFNMTEYSIRVGSVQYPAEPVQCQYGDAAGPGGVRGEHLTELEKCFGTLGSTVGVGSLNGFNFATGDCDVANMAGVIAPGNADASYQFCPFAIDMESFQRVTAGHDGVNTADRSTPITLQLTIGAAAGEAVSIDAFVCYDSLFYIDSSGSIRVNF
tara:strand:+ start:2446 stop:3903 length:1458 start_codon:yes stop_codon:yes gene_type:complete